MKIFKYTYLPEDVEKSEELTGVAVDVEKCLETNEVAIDLKEVCAIYYKFPYKGQDRCSVILNTGDVFTVIYKMKTLVAEVEKVKQMGYLGIN